MSESLGWITVAPGDRDFRSKVQLREASFVYCDRALQLCLQTSCWVLQLSEHGVDPAGLVALGGPTLRQVL